MGCIDSVDKNNFFSKRDSYSVDKMKGTAGLIEHMHKHWADTHKTEGTAHLSTLD